jgi:hypothetical protein
VNPEIVAVSPGVDIDADRLSTLTMVADHLIPAAHGMPSAAEIVSGSQVRFVLRSRPDLAAPLHRALHPELGPDPQGRLDELAKHDPEAHAAVQLTVVAGYYTDPAIRARIGYPGQESRPVNALDYPAYVAEGLLDAVVRRGPIWRDPSAQPGRH